MLIPPDQLRRDEHYYKVARITILACLGAIVACLITALLNYAQYGLLFAAVLPLDTINPADIPRYITRYVVNAIELTACVRYSFKFFRDFKQYRNPYFVQLGLILAMTAGGNVFAVFNLVFVGRGGYYIFLFLLQLIFRTLGLNLLLSFVEYHGCSRGTGGKKMGFKIVVIFSPTMILFLVLYGSVFGGPLIAIRPVLITTFLGCEMASVLGIFLHALHVYWKKTRKNIPWPLLAALGSLLGAWVSFTITFISFVSLEILSLTGLVAFLVGVTRYNRLFEVELHSESYTLFAGA